MLAGQLIEERQALCQCQCQPARLLGHLMWHCDTRTQTTQTTN